MVRRRQRYYSSYYDFGYFPPSVPREAKGGIKAQTKRGSFGESWWAKRWIQVLESFNIGARLGRGRSYARSGQVLSIDVGQGKITAKVQGSRATPYSITIQVKLLIQGDWEKVLTHLGEKPIYAAKLLAGEMPQDIETIFKDLELSLFPSTYKDLSTECSCPDWSNPCKHIAAVFYLLGEEFDRDPFILFKIRGMSRETLISKLSATASQETSSPTPEAAEETFTPEPLPTDPQRFWKGEALPEELFGEVRIPAVPAVLPKQLGKFPLWRGKEKFQEAMETLYSQASPKGLEVFLGERE
jgi:uncharacterized Zn finger protein